MDLCIETVFLNFVCHLSVALFGVYLALQPYFSLFKTTLLLLSNQKSSQVERVRVFILQGGHASETESPVSVGPQLHLVRAR